MTRFVGIPTVPLDTDTTVARVLLALKENVELLTDQRGESDRASAALTVGIISIVPVTYNFQGTTARARGVTMNGVNVPLLEDYAAALQDIQRLAADVATLRETVNLLITQLRS